MYDGLRELRQLLHAERVGVERAVTSFAQTDVEQRFVCPLKRGFRRKAREFRHERNKANAAHPGDERITLRHVADGGTNLLRSCGDVLAEDARRSRGSGVESEQRMNQRGLPRAVRPEQPDGTPAQRAAQIFEHLAFAELYAQPVKFDYRVHQ